MGEDALTHGFDGCDPKLILLEDEEDEEEASDDHFCDSNVPKKGQCELLGVVDP